MVYGRTGSGDLTEDAPRRRFGTHYADSKLLGEKIALDLAAGGRAPAVVLQPTNVYGPNGDVWARDVVTRLRSGLVPLLDGGKGLCNHVYVDDVVRAMLLASVAEGVVGEAFLISSTEPVTWQEFYGRFECLLGAERTVEMSGAEAAERWRESLAAVPRLHRELAAAARSRRLDLRKLFGTREGRAVRKGVVALLPESWQERIRRRLPERPAAAAPLSPTGELPVHLLAPAEIAYFTAQTRVRIDKARRLLGYDPMVDLDQGMQLTAAWLAEVGLLDPERPADEG
jgi:nucleoside-diphosphate-sugar epimerase